MPVRLAVSRRQQLNLTSLGGVLLIVGVLVVLNLLAGWVFARWDLSDGKVYSLSAASKKLVRSLEDPVLLKVFFSPQLPAPYNTQTAYVRDLLGEYQTYSRGKVRPEFIGTDDEEKFRRDALSAGMLPVRFTSIASDQLQVKEGFMGLALYYGDKKEVIPVIKETTGMEYDLTSAIRRLTIPQKKAIAFTTGHGERSLTGEQHDFREALGQLYEVKDLDLKAKPTEYLELTALCVLGPKEPWDEKSLYALDQWIMRGTPTALFLDKYIVDLQMFWARAVNTGLEPLLAQYGLKVENDLIFDRQCQRVSMASRQGQFQMTTIMDYPLLPLVNRFSRSHPAVKGLEVVA
ncbi:MAG: GldG family protein, partial [Elusimicrobia bacterium]|nr:GldG family protein [Elusimicrobiota bacterium]